MFWNRKFSCDFLPVPLPHHLHQKMEKKQASIKTEYTLRTTAAVLPKTISPYNCAKLLISDDYRLLTQYSTSLLYHIVVVELVPLSVLG